jgi:hypothetical protein
MINFSQVFEGWRNKLIPPSQLKELIRQTSDQRLNICSECPHHSKNHKTRRPDDHCTYCGCTLSAKTKCLSCKCPIDKWLEVASQEEDEKIQNIADGKEEKGS